MKRKLNKKRVIIATATAFVAVSGIIGMGKSIARFNSNTVPRTEYTQMVTEFSGVAHTTLQSEKITLNLSEYIISDFPHINQSEDFPTGCESVASVCLMNYCGVDITPDEFIDNYLAMGDYPYYDEYGVMHGEDPNEVFIGDPRSKSGYGCYAPVIEKAVKKALPDNFSVKIVDNRRLTLEQLSREYIAKGIPVAVWTTMEMKTAENGRSWLLPDGSKFTFIRPEHCLVLIGFDSENFYFSDSRAEESVTAYPKEACEEAFASLGRQAVVIEKDT